MKTTLGGDRLGSGNKQNVDLKTYNRSTHDLSYAWRSSMSSGTLVPFMSRVALPGDSWDIDLDCQVMTLPTIGPLFGSYKVQLDVFSVPVRLYQGKLHMNMNNIGLDMSAVKLPVIHVPGVGYYNSVNDQTFNDNEQIGSSCILKYLGISGLGKVMVPTDNEDGIGKRKFNAVPLLAYWDIFKNYYSNKQEENAYVIHTGLQNSEETMTPIGANMFRRIDGYPNITSIFETTVNLNGTEYDGLEIILPDNAVPPTLDKIKVKIDNANELLLDKFSEVYYSPIGDGDGRRNRDKNQIIARGYTGASANVNWRFDTETIVPQDADEVPIKLYAFPLENIDKMRQEILSDVMSASAFDVSEVNLEPYNLLQEHWGDYTENNLQLSITKSQEGLAVKTYQSDLFNNWISTEWIDGNNGINAITAVDTTGDSFTIDALNLANKVYNMLNRIAISGGTYDDWLDAVYTYERKKSVESPVYMGGLIKELAFEEVISQAETSDMPLGTLAGRGRLTNKHKGGKINIKVDEPSYIMGIVSITPRVDYSQGNQWDVNLQTMDDFHKPALDAIGFQDLITEQMHWGETFWNALDGNVQYQSAGKQPAWINYMTDYNRTYGNFAEPNKEMFMTLNRRYEPVTGESYNGIPVGNIKDLTTYIDPSKYNNIFADTRLDAQNFWVQIGVGASVRRIMSAKVIPNL